MRHVHMEERTISCWTLHMQALDPAISNVILTNSTPAQLILTIQAANASWSKHYPLPVEPTFLISISFQSLNSSVVPFHQSANKTANAIKQYLIRSDPIPAGRIRLYHGSPIGLESFVDGVNLRLCRSYGEFSVDPSFYTTDNIR